MWRGQVKVALKAPNICHQCGWHARGSFLENPSLLLGVSWLAAYLLLLFPTLTYCYGSALQSHYCYSF